MLVPNSNWPSRALIERLSTCKLTKAAGRFLHRHYRRTSINNRQVRIFRFIILQRTRSSSSCVFTCAKGFSDVSCARQQRYSLLQVLSTCASSHSAPSVIVAGGGAAGLTAAYFAAGSGAEVSAEPSLWVPRLGHPAGACSRTISPLSANELKLTLCSTPVEKLSVLASVQVTVLERTREAGKKVLISGGARW